jgi:mRNA interferase MazF
VEVTRGEVWWVKMPLPVGRRPVVLVSRDAAYAVKTKVTVAEVSTTVRGIPSEVVLGRSDGLPRACAVNTDNLATIPKARLEARIALLRREKVAALDEALRFALGLS